MTDKQVRNYRTPCPNPWHAAAPVRMTRLCPECPIERHLYVLNQTLSVLVNHLVGQSGIIEPRPVAEAVAKVTELRDRYGADPRAGA